jgi:membrane protease YdiL (CAAX protease family)
MIYLLECFTRMNILYNDFGRLRSGWRLLIYALPFYFLTNILAVAVRVLYQLTLPWPIPHRQFVFELIFRSGLLIFALGLGFICATVLEDLPWRSLGLTLHKGWFKDLAIGFGLGFAALAAAVVIAIKGFNFSLSKDGLVSVVTSMIGSAGLLFVAALAEEAMFRGYGLQTLSRANLAWLGVLLTSVPFGVVHLDNPNVVPGVTFANTVLAGVWMSIAYLRTRSLWFPLGIHWSWNWALGWFFGLPVSGLTLVSHPLFVATDSGPKWLTGGSYGIEGGVAAMISLIIVTIFVWRTSIVSATPELMKMTSEENPANTGPVLNIRTADDQA